MFLQFQLHVINFFELIKEPRINRSHLGQLLNGVALTQRVANVGEPLGMRCYQALGENLGFNFFSADALSRVQCAHSFHEGFFESTADGHDLAHRFHLRAEVLVCSGEFLELPLGNLHHDVIERGFEASRSLARNVVGNFIKRVTHCQLRGNFGDGKSGCFRSQCG